MLFVSTVESGSVPKPSKDSQVHNSEVSLVVNGRRRLGGVCNRIPRRRAGDEVLAVTLRSDAAE